MKIYIDSEYKCHVTDDGTLTAVEVPFFDGKCDAFIEGYRFVPAGESWTNEDGETFEGEMRTTWKDSRELETIQREYEKQLLAEYEAELEQLKENSIPIADLEEAYQEGVNSAYDQPENDHV